MWLMFWVSLGFAQDGVVRYPHPNVILGVGPGRPAVLGIRAEGWIADQLSTEIGVGLQRFDFEGLEADLCLRVRPDAFCVGCGNRDLLTVGVGIAAVGTAPVDFETWRLAFGPDVAVTGVHWLDRELGLQATVRGGAGPVLAGPDPAIDGVDWWLFGTLGLAF